MNIYDRKRSLILILTLMVGIQPITGYPYYNEPTFTEKLWETIQKLAIPILGTTIAAYIAAKIMKHVQEEVKTPTTAKKTITFKNYIGVPEEAVNLVEQLNNPKKYKQMGISIPRGILLTGDPGTGKTYLAQAIAGEVNCPFFEFSASDFAQMHLGLALKAIHGAFQTARDAAKKAGKNIAIIFIDEFDALGSRTSEKSSQYYTMMINTFLTEMSGFEKGEIPVLVIGATNFPENIDSAIRRPGRFDYIIHIPYPQKEDRLKLLTLAAQNKPMDPNISFNNLADATEGMSPADITLLFDLAGNIALKHNNIERDYDSFVKAIWQIKEKNYMLKMASREDRKNLIDTYLQKLNITKLSTEDLINQTTNMTKTDINEIFEKAHKFSQEQPKKSFIDWLWVAIEAKKQQRKIRKNKEAFALCKKIYAPHSIEEHDTKELITIDPDDIFNEFNVSYNPNA